MTKPHGQEKHRLRENLKRVRSILRDQWDPIGLDGNPEDEYHTYADRAYAMMIRDGASTDEVARYLHWVETDYMGLSGGTGVYRNCLAIAEKIFALKEEFQRPLQ